MFFFFFFKQKTAYEMRISDWSSDVCSSDLTTGLGLEPRRNRAAAAAPGFDQREWRRVVRLARLARDLFDQDRRQNLACQPGVEIGRASCRERVCQYV